MSTGYLQRPSFLGPVKSIILKVNSEEQQQPVYNSHFFVLEPNIVSSQASKIATSRASPKTN